MTSPEAAPEDVQEQLAPVVDEPADPVLDPAGTAVELPREADEADVVEQHQEVPLDEEDAPIG